MNSESEIILAVSKNVDRLIDQCDQLKVEKQTLVNANQELEETVRAQQEEIKELHQNNELLKVARSLAGSDEKNTETKLKINELVREIDRCISLLNK